MKKMRKVFSATLCVLLLLMSIQSLMLVAAESDDWIEIYTFEDLYDVRYDLSAKYKLMNDIDMTEWIAAGGDYDFSNRGWNPIGSNNVYSNASFKGIFDGNNHVLSGLRISVSSFPSGAGDTAYFGLFSSVSGTIKNLVLKGNITINDKKANYAGGIAAVLSTNGVIENCTSFVDIVAKAELNKKEDVSQYIGGIVGSGHGTIKSCCNAGSVFGQSDYYESQGSYGGVIFNYYRSHVAGISGSGSSNQKIQYCANMGDISTANVKDSKCFASGISNFAGEIVDCYNTGKVTGSRQNTAGISLANSSTIINCYNIGEISGDSRYAISKIEATNCFYLRNTGSSSTGATACTEVQLKKQITFTNWDFENIWTFDAHEDYEYPELQSIRVVKEEDLKPKIDGYITIDGEIEIGSVLSANIEGVSPNDATISYQWIIDGIEKSSTNTYTIQSEDFEKTLHLIVRGINEYRGKLVTTLLLVPVHRHIEIILPAVSPTCTESGFTEGKKCSDCGEILVEQIEIPALGHTTQTYSQDSTCAENGFTITICTRCGETLSKEILQRLEHTWTSEVTQNPTCTAQGVKTYTCESCGETYTEPVDVLAHEWDDGKMTKAPSCTEAGEMTYTCATGGETRTEPIDKLDHEIVLVAGKAATCTDPGLTDGWQCKMCKKWFAEQQTIPALDHDPQIGKVVEPTCEEPGYTPFVCTRCGETISKTDPTDALGHDMQPTYVWAKDDSTVTATMVCTRCDKTGMTETAKVKTEVTVKPTCSTEGELTLIAAFNNKSFYGQVKTKTLPRDPDAHVFRVTVTPPTCIDEGYTTHACTLCRYGYADEIVPPTGHTPVTDDAVPATCEQPGLTEGSHCSVCGDVLTPQEEVPVLDHADADNDGLCDTCGNQMTGDDHCKYCGKVHAGAFGWLIRFFHNILAIFKR